MPVEKYRALIRTQEFMRDLLDPKKTPKVPTEVRKNAYWCLRHFPWLHEFDELAKQCPEILMTEKQDKEFWECQHTKPKRKTKK